MLATRWMAGPPKAEVSSMSMFVRFIVLIFGLLAISQPSLPTETASFLRSGYFREITDTQSAGYVILNLRMSADGSKIVFLTSSVAGKSLRIIDADGSNERVIYSDPPNNVYPRVMDSFAISDDGGTVVHGRFVNPSNNQSELRIYDTASQQDTLLLRVVPYLSFGVGSLENISHFSGTRLLALSGDGAIAFFINSFGPIGSGNAGQSVSGQTLYKVDLATKSPVALFSQSGLSSVPNLSASAVELLSSFGSLATDGDGSIVMLPVGSSGGSGHLPYGLLRIFPGGAPSVVLQLSGTLFTGPSLNSAGTRMAVSRRGGGLVPEGMFTIGTGGGSPIVLDTEFLAGRPPLNPRLSRDGSAVSYRIELGGSDEPSVRWVAADGSSDPLPVSQNTIDVGGSSSDKHDISADGGRIAFIGGVRHMVGAPGADVVVFDWTGIQGVPNDIPVVNSVVADPDFDFVIQPFPTSQETHAFSYDPSGANLGNMQSWIFNHEGRDLRAFQFSGTGNSFADVFDNGSFGDETAGDGIYDDAGIWAFSAAEAGSPTGRGAITSTNQTASFVDFPLTVRPPVAPTAGFTASPSIGAAPLTVNFASTTTGDFVFLDYDTNDDGFLDRFGVGDPFAFEFTTAGSRTMTMRARGFGNEDSVTRQDVVLVLAPGTQVDLGDAPAGYPTLFADEGAAHALGSGLILGAAADGEASAQPSGNARGDDADGTDDEVGVVFTTTLEAGSPVGIRVTTSAAGKLDAWIDYNDDGDWDDSGERIFDNRSLASGVNNLTTAAIPGNAVAGQTYARFRLSSVGGLAPRGPAADGEVEDYLVTVQSPDSDGDGLTDSDEILVHGTNPAKRDTDGDGTSDGDEIATGRDPLANEPAAIIAVIIIMIDDGT